MSVIEQGLQSIIKRISNIEISWEKQNVLITGGAGFLGSWIADVLIELGSKVLVLDNLSSGLKSNINHLISTDSLRFINHDISIPIEIDGTIDYVFHLASRASPFEFTKFPIEILKANTLGILNALEISRTKNAKFLYTSTSEIYGNPDSSHIPTQETFNGNVNPIGPRSCYDEAKRVGEAFVMAYILEFNLNARIVRIFNTYGPRMRSGDVYGRVIPNFIEQGLRDQPLTVFGDGTQTRSFSYVTDTVEGIIRCAFLPQTKGEVFNIGNKKETSIISLAKLILHNLNKNGRISYSSLPIDDPKRRCPDISKARKMLNWEPSVRLEEGIQSFINWYIQENDLKYDEK